MVMEFDRLAGCDHPTKMIADCQFAFLKAKMVRYWTCIPEPYVGCEETEFLHVPAERTRSADANRDALIILAHNS